METMINTPTNNTEIEMISRAEYDALQAKYEAAQTKIAEQAAEITELNQKLDCLMEQVCLAKKRTFGVSSELSGQEVLEQLSLLFNEAEVCSTEDGASEKETTHAAAYTRKKSGHVLDKLPDNVPVEVVEHRTPEEDRACPECGTTMEEIGKEVRRTLMIIPAQVKIREERFYTYACPNCKENGTEVPVKQTERTPAVIPGSYASPEAIAHIATQKFVMGSPLYRQEQEWERQGIMLSRQTMSNWLLMAVELWLNLIYSILHQKLLAHQVLHADETTLQVLREPGKTSQSKSYMWLYRTGGDAACPIVLFEYQPNRSGKNAAAFLEGFTGWLHADGYVGYHALPENIRIVGCWTHARRKFDEALNAVPKEKRPGFPAAVGLAYIARLFKIEKELAKCSPEERKEERLKLEKPVLDELLAWAETQSPPPKSSLGKALHYLREQWPYLIRYLEDGRLEISNNRAERSIKPFVIGRKNFLFANTPRGAQGSAVLYSLVETARENSLDPYRYLVWVLETAPVLAKQEPPVEDEIPAWAEKLLPWNAPESCRAPGKNEDS